MTFATFSVLACLAGVVVISWLPPKRLQPYYITLAGGLFLAFSDPLSMLILCLSSLLIYLICNRPKFNGKYLSIAISICTVLFIYFKRRVINGSESVLIPLGLSYYLFRQIHYAFEQYKQTLRRHNFGEFICYLLLLPPIIVGPIHRFPAFINDLRRRRWEWSRFSLGLERAFHGYAKLIILANFLIAGPLKNVIYKTAENAPLFLAEFLRSTYHWIDLYLHFSAYSDIAIGVSAMMGFTIIENFNKPFLATSISDFWTRWHISLTGWCRDYVYKPIAALTRKPFIAIISTMLVIGLWHEFSLRYILWGAYHAMGILIFNRWKILRDKLGYFNNPQYFKLIKIISIVLTMIFVIASFPVTSWAQRLILNLIKGS